MAVPLIMLAKLSSYTLVGIDAASVEVEVDVSPATMPKTVLVGLAEAAVRESTHRVERALVNSGYRRPIDRIIINLAPADLKKDAGGFDLPIALGMLIGSGQVAIERKGDFAVVGELALDGETRPIKGVLAMALAAAQEGKTGLLVPSANAAEAAVVEGIDVYPVGSLAEAVGFLAGQIDTEPKAVDLTQVFQTLAHYEDDFVDVKGQDYAKRALVIAAAGSHNVLMIGPPGTGKTLLAKRLGSIMPPLTPAESLETTRIYSAMGLLKAGQPLMAVRPFRHPHHSVSDAGLVGGGSIPQPGEISLAHKGILFLDELPEFNRKTLEVLRQPLEDGEVTISRALRSTNFPAEFLLVAAMNPCPCGYRSDPRRACTCSPPQVEKYLSRISGPLLDRIDLHVEVPAVPFAQLSEAPPGPTSADLLAEVLKARVRQTERFGKQGPGVNGRMTPRQVRKFCSLRPESASLLKGAMEELGLSARAHDKILRVARTMADLEGHDAIQPHNIAEAVGFRSLDRGGLGGLIRIKEEEIPMATVIETPLATIQTLDDLLEHLGGIAPSRVRFRPLPGTATEADLIAVNDRKQGICELVDGILVEKGMGYTESYLAIIIGGLLNAYVLPRNLGVVSGADGMMRLFPGLVREPDVAFASWDRMPGRRVPIEPIAGFAPDLAIEVLNKSNTKCEMARKRREYFEAGVRLVWEINLVKRTVTVYEGAERSTVLDASQTLGGGEVLPGFVLPLAELFGELDRRAGA